MSCSLVDSYKRFDRPCCLHRHEKSRIQDFISKLRYQSNRPRGVISQKTDITASLIILSEC